MLLLPLLLVACESTVKISVDDTGRPDTDTDADADTDADTDADADTDTDTDTDTFLASEADVVLYGEDRQDGTGNGGLASAGDITGDGAPDLLAAAQGRSVGGGTYNGQAYVIALPAPGEASITTSRTLIDGVTDYSGFGSSVSAAGDVDGDGSDDILIGAHGESTAYIFHGPLPEGRMTADDAELALGTTGANDYTATLVGFAGDIDGDGLDDVIVNALQGPGGDALGAVYINLAASNIGYAPVGDDALVITGAESRGRVGGTPATTADLDGDGQLDLVVTGFDSGAGIFYGPLGAGERTLADADGWLAREAQLDFTGSALAADDFDADGYADLAIGAPAAIDAGLGSGAVFLAFGGDRLSGEHALADGGRLNGAEGDYTGVRLASPGDIDDDGVADLLVGAIYRDSGADRGGGAWLVHGPLTTEHRLLGGDDTDYIGDIAWGQLGTTLGGVVDFDADGALDIALGAFAGDQPGHGAIYLFSGG